MLTTKSLPTMQMGQQALLKQNMASAVFTVRKYSDAGRYDRKDQGKIQAGWGMVDYQQGPDKVPG